MACCSLEWEKCHLHEIENLNFQLKFRGFIGPLESAQDNCKKVEQIIDIDGSKEHSVTVTSPSKKWRLIILYSTKALATHYNACFLFVALFMPAHSHQIINFCPTIGLLAIMLLAHVPIVLEVMLLWQLIPKMYPIHPCIFFIHSWFLCNIAPWSILQWKTAKTT